MAGKGLAGPGVGARVTGTWVLLVALALSVAAGLIHRRSDGRLRSVRKPGNATASRSVQPGGPADSRTDQGAPDPEPASPEPAASPTPEPGDLRPLLIGLGLTPGVSATLVQFSSAFCAPAAPPGGS